MEILFIILVLVFILSRLWSQLGNFNEEDEIGASSCNFMGRNEKERKIIDITDKAHIVKSDNLSSDSSTLQSNEAMDYIDHNAKDEIISVFSKINCMNIVEFMDGAEYAVEMILKALSANDRDTLKLLLSPDMCFDVFAYIDRLHKEDKKANSVLIAIES